MSEEPERLRRAVDRLMEAEGLGVQRPGTSELRKAVLVDVRDILESGA